MVAGWVERLAEVDGQALSDPERIDLLAALEGLKGAAAAAQARVTVAFAASQRDALTATLTATEATAPAGHCGRDRVRSVERMIQRSVGSQVALARRVSPRQGSRHLGLARALVEELPETMAALTAGQTSEWRATLVAEQTACLSREDRTRVDAELATRPGGIPAMGDRRIASEARRIGYRLDPTAVLRRTQRATGQRCVTLRPAPEAMTWLTALLPVASGVAAHAALTRAADTARAHGDPRTRGQLMADLLTTRLTHPLTQPADQGDPVGYDPARWDTPPPAPIPVPGGKSGHGAPAGTRVEVHLVMTDTTLLGDDPTPAELLGYGPIPAPIARRLLTDTPDQVWVRRLYTDPNGPTRGRLTATDPRARAFPTHLRRLLILRDEVCRTPWCDAPIRHADHITAHTDGGPTTLTNGQGLCEACNHTKQTPGWTTRPHPGPPEPDQIITTTPTGHPWTSHDPARWHPPPPSSPGEHRLRTLLTAA